VIRASFFYPATPGARFDFEYYLDRHVPLARRLLGDHGLVKLEIDRGVSGEELGSEPRWVCVAHLYFESVEDFYRALDAVGDELGADVPNYTDIAIETQVSDIVAA
jgi:uncharacterized protein (TIGR02118 family)